MWKFILFLSLSSLFCVSSEAQDIHVFYDLYTDSIRYVLDGKPVYKLKLRKGDRVSVHFTEYNPYLYDASADVKQEDSEVQLAGFITGALQSFLPQLSTFMPSTPAPESDSSGHLSLLHLPLAHLGQSALKMKDMFSNTRGAAQLLSMAQASLQDLASTQQEMEEIYENVQKIEKSERAAQLAVTNLDRIPYNPMLKPSTIKKLSAEFYQMVFRKEPGDTDVTLDDVMKWDEIPGEKERLLENLGARQLEFKQKSDELTPIAKDLANLDLGSSTYTDFTRDLVAVQRQSATLDKKVSAYIKRHSQDSLALTSGQMMDLRLRFLELLNNTYSYDCVVQIEKETAYITATFTPRDSVPTDQSVASAGPKIKTLKLEAKGGMHVSASVGANFSSYLNPARTYSVRDGKIVSDKAGVFQPSLGSYIHFYPNYRRNITLGGSFGVGFGFGSADAESISFFLGPSLIFGKGQRIVVTGGLMGGQVNRLRGGFHEGDSFDLNNGDIPTGKRYELGLFTGISFNLNGN